MYNAQLLNDIITKKGIMRKHLAQVLGITPYGFSLKVSGKNEFRASEIRLLSKELRLTVRERDRIFFGD